MWEENSIKRKMRNWNERSCERIPSSEILKELNFSAFIYYALKLFKVDSESTSTKIRNLSFLS
jgi:hypothetical protein